MERVIFFESTFEPFTSSWGALCVPLAYSDELRSGYIMSLGWEDELIDRNIIFTEIEIVEEPTE